VTARASDVNRAYYERLQRGRNDYWHRMAAPRFRLATLLRLLGEATPDRVVDLGCGGGQLLAALRRRHPGVAFTGVDLSVNQIGANRERMPDVDWHACDLDEGLSPSVRGLAGTFDAVIASELIEHVARPDALLSSSLLLARPRGGRLLLSTQSGPVRETERRVGHRRHFSAAEMAGLLAEGGWTGVRVWNCGFPFHDLSKWYANLDPDRSMRRFGEQAYGPVEVAVCLALRGLFRLNSRTRGAQLFAVASRP
jgi:2-polyprenyl-3-methyl-5-hydroxy-6-metoxy-1,4-benzoquinol methylase